MRSLAPLRRVVPLLVLALVAAVSGPGCKKSSSSPTGPDDPGDPGGGDTGLGAPVEALAVQMFGSGEDATEFATESIEIAARAVWVATELTGNPEGTFTGTLTQVGGAESETFTYEATPTDRMQVVLAGLGVPIELTYASFAGYVEGTWEEFRDYHDDLRYRIVLGDALDLSVASLAGAPREEISARRARTSYDRAIQGTLDYDGVPLTIDLLLESTIDSEVDVSFSSYDTYQEATGTIASPTSAIEVREVYQYKSIFGDVAAQNIHLWNDSVATLDGVTYAYVGAYVRREYVDGALSQTDYWLTEGSLVRDGTVIGQVTWDGPILTGTRGPNAQVLLADGSTLPLETVVVGRRSLRSGWWSVAGR